MTARLKAFRSEIIAMMGVLAVCGIGAAIFAWIHIQGQNHEMAQMGTRNGQLVIANRQWAAHAKELNRLRMIEQQNAHHLKAKLAAIEQQNNRTATQLKGMAATNKKGFARCAAKIDDTREGTTYR